MINSMFARTREDDMRRRAGRLLAGAAEPLSAGHDAALAGEFLRSHGIGPCLGEMAMTDPALRRFLPDDLSMERSVAVEMARQEEFVTVLKTLQAKYPSRPPVIFKGQALAYLIYPKSWHRPRDDIDALIGQDDFDSMKQSLRGLGYESVNAVDGELVLRQSSLKKHRYGIDHVWDVHWSISNRPSFASFLSYEHLLDTGITVRAGGVTFTAPNAVNNLLIACLHLVGHHAHDIRLIWLYDIHLMAGRLSEPQRREFLDMAVSRPEIRTACHAALTLTLRYLPAEATADLQQTLDSGQKRRLRLKRFYLTQLVEDASALDRGNRLRFARQHLFPSADYMTRRFGIRHRWQLPFWYALRIVRAIPKLFRRR